MKKETVLSFSLGVIVGAAGMWALTPQQTTFEEGIIEYAPASGDEEMSMPESNMPAESVTPPAHTPNPMEAAPHSESSAAPITSDATAAPTAGEATAVTSSNEAATEQSEASAAGTTETAPAPVSGIFSNNLTVAHEEETKGARHQIEERKPS